MFAVSAVVLLCAVYNTDAHATNGVGFVNMPVILEQAPQAKATRARLQKEFSGRRQKLEDCGEDIGELDRMLRREGREMEKSRRDRMIDRIKKRRRECNDLREEFEADFNRRRTEELNTLQKQISAVIRGIADRRKFKMIVGPPIIYVDDQMDLTTEVLDALSRESQ